jgi:OOP family OmpA-OmpF porin
MSINKIFSHFMPSYDVSARASACMLALLAGALGQASAADQYNSDRTGGADHPLLSRYQGSILYMYGESPVGTAQAVVQEKGKALMRPVEGRISNRLYWGPKGRSPLEIFRNYQQALSAAGFQIAYACETAKCDTERVQPLIEETPRQAVWKTRDSLVDSTFNSGSQPGFHYLSARKTSPAGTTWVTVAVAGGFPDAPVSGRVRQFVQIVEPAQVELGKVSVDARQIEGGLKRDGKIALYGVTFATNKADLTKQSDAQLGEMAQVLKTAPAMKVFIVGHTDNQGEFQANAVLSQKRAEAVAVALSSRFGVASDRLVARGVANLAPVASNESEQGRAQNRRVEMVLR